MKNSKNTISPFFQVAKLFFFFYISWFFPCELLTVRKMGKQYANPKRFLFSLAILLVLSWINKSSQNKDIGLVLLFCGLLTLIYFFESLRLYYEEEKKKIARNPLSWGIPLLGIPRNEWFWYLFQPLMIISLSFLFSFFSRTLFFYFLLSAIFLWIFRFLSFRFYKEKEIQPPWDDDFSPQEDQIVNNSTEIIDRSLGNENQQQTRLNPQLISLVVIGSLVISSFILHEKPFFSSFISGSSYSLSKTLAKEEEQLSSSMPFGWTLKTALSKEEFFYTVPQLLEKYQNHPHSFFQQLWSYWREEKAEVVCGRFTPKKIEPLWAPFTGVMIAWIPVEENRKENPDVELWTYIETPSSLYSKLSKSFLTRPSVVITFGKDLKAYIFDVTQLNGKTLFHTVIPFPFTLNIAGCSIVQNPQPYYVQNAYQSQGQKIKEFIIKRQKELLTELKTTPLTKEKLEEIKKEANILKTKLAEIEGKK
ncbi:hypothetical protein [Methylacidiphilum caldifontis]|nr:hypothetical protein [Methylacidiphilum caldifontis]